MFGFAAKARCAEDSFKEAKNSVWIKVPFAALLPEAEEAEQRQTIVRLQEELSFCHPFSYFVPAAYETRHYKKPVEIFTYDPSRQPVLKAIVRPYYERDDSFSVETLRAAAAIVGVIDQFGGKAEIQFREPWVGRAPQNPFLATAPHDAKRTLEEINALLTPYELIQRSGEAAASRRRPHFCGTSCG